MKNLGYLLIIGLALGLYLTMSMLSTLGVVLFLGCLFGLIGVSILSIKV